jgi:hypothetical protein
MSHTRVYSVPEACQGAKWTDVDDAHEQQKIAANSAENPIRLKGKYPFMVAEYRN